MPYAHTTTVLSCFDRHPTACDLRPEHVGCDTLADDPVTNSSAHGKHFEVLRTLSAITLAKFADRNRTYKTL